MSWPPVSSTPPAVGFSFLAPAQGGWAEAFKRAGLSVGQETSGSRTTFVVAGNTHAHKDALKRHGGRWSPERRSWLFMSETALAAAAGDLEGAMIPGGLAESPGSYEADPQSFSRARKEAQNSGHRNRLRKRFLEAGKDSLPDYELLELLLFFSIEIKDTKPLAKDLLARCGSLGAVLNLDPQQIHEFTDLRIENPEIEGYLAYRLSDSYVRDRKAAPDEISEEGLRWSAFEQEHRHEVRRLWRRRETRILLAAIQELLVRVLREQIQGRPIIGSWTALIDYLHTALAHEPIEQFRVLFLDRKNTLIRDEVQQRGTVDHTPLYPRELAKRALELQASAVIMVHNHPSGDPTPSRADIQMTKHVVAALEAVGVTVHDHVIIGKNKHTSFKSQRLF